MTTIIKLGGRVQASAKLAPALAGLWKEAPGSFCIVHGGGDEVSAMQRQLGREPRFVNGRRVTTAEDIELVRMVLSGSANKRLVSALVSCGIPAVGISGEDAGLITADLAESGELGRVGRPRSVNARVVQALLGAELLPVISPLARDADSEGEALNVNGDDAAAAIATELGGELWLVSDVEGVMNADSRIVDALDRSLTDAMIADGTVNSGMRAKLEAGFNALENGAAKVRITGLDGLSDLERGTTLTVHSGAR